VLPGGADIFISVASVTLPGNEYPQERFLQNIYHPRNAFNVQIDTHDILDELAWGIACRRTGKTV
jgi:hypothetical protein